MQLFLKQIRADMALNKNQIYGRIIYCEMYHILGYISRSINNYINSIFITADRDSEGFYYLQREDKADLLKRQDGKFKASIHIEGKQGDCRTG